MNTIYSTKLNFIMKHISCQVSYFYGNTLSPRSKLSAPSPLPHAPCPLALSQYYPIIIPEQIVARSNHFFAGN